MSWDPTWESIFAMRDWGRYPPEAAIRFVARSFYAAPDRSQVKILEVGCGAGANVWFLAREGFDAYGIDGSSTAIIKAQRRLRVEGLSAQLRVGDIINLANLYPPASFDAVLDVACLQHNRGQAVASILDQVFGVLKPNGRIFSMMVAQGSYGDGLGREVEPGTFTDIQSGPLQGKGLCHFFTGVEVKALFGRFAEVQLEYTLSSLNQQQNDYKHWVTQAIKRP